MSPAANSRLPQTLQLEAGEKAGGVRLLAPEVEATAGRRRISPSLSRGAARSCTTGRLGSPILPFEVGQGAVLAHTPCHVQKRSHCG